MRFFVAQAELDLWDALANQNAVLQAKNDKLESALIALAEKVAARPVIQEIVAAKEEKKPVKAKLTGSQFVKRLEREADQTP